MDWNAVAIGFFQVLAIGIAIGSCIVEGLLRRHLKDPRSALVLEALARIIVFACLLLKLALDFAAGPVGWELIPRGALMAIVAYFLVRRIPEYRRLARGAGG